MRVSIIVLWGSTLTVGMMTAQNTVQNVTYGSGQTLTVVGPTSIAADTNVTVAAGANISYKSTSSVVLGPGFHAASGGTFSASIVPDTIIPTVSSFAATSTESESFTVGWIPGDIYITGYAGLIASQQIQLNSGSILTLSSTATSQFFSSLSPSTAYTVKLQVQDAAGNWSGWNQITVTTTSGDPNADDDGDGISNGVEAILGTTPSSANSSDSGNGNQLQIHRPHQ